MRKILFLLMFLPFISYADIVDNLKTLETLTNEKQYERAIEYGNSLLENDNISDIDKKVVQLFLKDVELKKNEQAQKNDEQTLQVVDGLPQYKKITSDDFDKYDQYERSVLKTKDPDAIYALAKLYASDGLYEKAMDIALNDNTHQDYNVYIAATAARMIGYYTKSIDLYTKLINKNPNNPKCLLGLAMAYKGIDDIPDALIYMQEYYNINPSDDIAADIKLMKLAIQQKQ